MNNLPVVSSTAAAQSPAVLLSGDGPRSVSDLGALLAFLRRHRLLIALVTLAMTLIGVLVAVALPSVFRSTVTLMIEPRAQQVVEVQEVYDPTVGIASEYLATQYELLRSRGLADRVVDKLKLADDPAFFADRATQGMVTSVALLLGLKTEETDEERAAQTPEQRRERAASQLMAQTLIQPVSRTRLVQVHFLSSDPARAQQIATALSEAYLESGLDSRLEATQRAGRWLTNKLDDLSAELKKAEAALQAYREENALVSVGSNRGLIDQELIDGTQRLRDAQRVKTELSSTYARVRAAGSDPLRLEQINALLQNGGVQRARDVLLDAEQQLRQVQQRYGDKHPQMAESQTRLDAARRALDTQLLVAAEGVRNQYEIAQETERQLSSVVASTTGRAQALDRKQFELGVLERNVESNRQLYELFLKRFKETDSTVNYEPLNVRITDRALLPQLPVQPNRVLLVLTAGLLGLMLGLLLAVLRQVTGEGVRTVEELEDATRLPLFGIVPKVSFQRGSLARHFLASPRTPFAEGVRSLKAALQLVEVAGRRQAYLVTSANPEEGKTSLAACLALALSASERVLLLEGDLRKPRLRGLLNFPKQHREGLLEVVQGKASLETALHPESDNLHVLAAAGAAGNPGETIGSPAFAALIDVLRNRYDRIIIDSPPVLAASDTLLLARLSDAVLFVTRAETTKLSTVRRAIHQLRVTGAPLVGCVLNRASIRRGADALGDYRYAYRTYG